jgi:NAD(P)-dependent dehydrogenase (short-subunit alcohol dehydrogenase family)
MAGQGSVVIVGGTSIFGTRLAEHYAKQGRKVYVTSREQARADELAQEVGGDCHGLSLDLTKPHDIEAALSSVEDVDRLVLLSILRDANSVRDYNIDSASDFIIVKLVGYTEVIHALAPRMRQDASIVLYGGNAKEWPYPGSTSVTTANGGIATMVNTLGVELAPIRVNAIHPSVVGDSPFWADKPEAVLELHRSRTKIGRLVSVDDVVDATVFLLENPAVTGVNLTVDGGTNLR